MAITGEIDSITVRYEADIRPYLRGLKRLEPETGKTLSKLDRQYDAQLTRISRRFSEVLTHASTAAAPIQIASSERALNGTFLSDAGPGSASSTGEGSERRTAESVRGELDEFKTLQQQIADLIEFIQSIPTDELGLALTAFKALLEQSGEIDRRPFDLDTRLDDLGILRDQIERDLERLATATGEDAARLASARTRQESRGLQENLPSRINRVGRPGGSARAFQRRHRTRNAD